MGVDTKLTGLPEFDSFEVIKTALVTSTFSASVLSEATIAHNLGFSPIAFVYYTDEAGTIKLPLPTWTGASIDTVNHKVDFNTWLYHETDETNLYIVLLNSLASTYTFSFRYYLCRSRS